MTKKLNAQYRHYNPNLKPSAYRPGYPNHTGFYYYGFPPDGGFTYSSYECSSCTETSILTAKHHNFCPRCGSKTLSQLDQSNENQEEIVQSISDSLITASAPCDRCGSHFVVGLNNPESLTQLHCPSCGCNMESAYTQLQSKLKEHDMKAGLLKVISELKARGETVLAEELEKEMDADLSSGVEMDLETGDRETDKKEIEQEEKQHNEAIDATVKDESMKKTIAQIKTLLKHDVQPAVVLTEAGYKVVAEDDLDEQLEDESEDEIVDEATANIIIKANAKKGIATRVTRVESGFIVKAEEMEMEEEDSEMEPSHNAEDELGHETVLPEEKAHAEMEDEQEEESAEDEVEILDEDEAEATIASIHKQGKNARVVRVESGFVVTAEEVQPDPENPELETTEEMKSEEDEQLDDDMMEMESESHNAEDELGHETILPEEQAKQAVAFLHSLGKNAKVTRVVSGYVVTAEEDEVDELEEVQEMKWSDEDEQLDLDSEEQVSSDELEDEAEEMKEELEDEGEEVEESLTEGDEKVVKAEEVQPDPENPELETTEEMKSDEKEEEMASDDQDADDFEKLTPVEALVDVEEDDVTMLLHADVNGDEFYNVIIKGNPVARISLASQEKPEEIREYFGTENYAMDVVDAMLKYGISKTLKSVKAKFYANEVTNTNLKESVTAELEDTFNKKYATAVAQVRDDLADRIAMVVAGVNKNYWRNEVNDLKSALFEQFEATGQLEDETIVAAIEAAFETGAAPLFGRIMDKAIAYLDYTPEALKEIKQAIGEADIQELDYEDVESEDEESEEEPSLASLLKSKNVSIK